MSEDVPSSEESDAPSTGSKLLALPPELRNRVYEYCLKAEYLIDTVVAVERSPGWSIEITKELKPPALLSTCQRVRDEASKIWHLSKQFWMRIEKYDATVFVAWWKHTSHIATRLGQRPQTTVSVADEPNWENLKQWCHAVWAGKPQRHRS